jgi:hypothetical protein
MSASHISGFAKTEVQELNNTLRHLGGNRPIGVSAATWGMIHRAITGIARSIERTGIAGDRKQLRMLCAQRHRGWD